MNTRRRYTIGNGTRTVSIAIVLLFLLSGINVVTGMADPEGDAPSTPISRDPTDFDGWHVLPIRSQEEFNQGMVGGEGEQHPHSIARSLNNTDTIYWSHDVGQVWKSIDGGDSWKKTLGKNLSLIHGQSIQVDPRDPYLVFVIMDTSYNYLIDPGYEGLYRSTDGGDNWEQVISETSTVNRIDRHNIAYDLSTVDNTSARRWYAAFPNEGLYRSNDRGVNWNMMTGLSGHDPVYQVQVHPTNGRVYLATDEGLFYSDDQGAALQALGDLPAGSVSSVQIDHKDPSNIYAVIHGQGLYKSVDGGDSFVLKKAFNAASAYINPGYPDTIYMVGIGSADNTIVSHDGGETWFEDVQVNPAPGLGRDSGTWKKRIAGDLSGIVPNPEDEDEAVAYSRAALWKTTDGGKNFSDSSTLFTGFAASWWNDAIVFDPADADRFATFNCDVAMAITENNGDYFDRRADGIWSWYSGGLIDWIGAYSGDIHPTNPDIIVASVGGYFSTQLMRTTNGGQTWSLITQGGSNVDKHLYIAFHPDDPDLVFAGDKMSTDAGQSFSHIDFGSYNTYDPYVIGLCRQHPDTVYAVSESGYRIFRSDDRGGNWTLYADQESGVRHRVLDSLPTITVDPLDNDTVYGLKNGDLAIYDGTSWTETGVLDLANGSHLGNFVRSVAVDPNNSSIIYVGMFSGGISNIWRSLDGGQSWQDISYNLPRVGIGSMSVSPHTGELLFGNAIGTWVFPSPDLKDNPLYDKAIPMPSCHDGLRNGDEEGIDCGGSCRACCVEIITEDLITATEDEEYRVSYEARAHGGHGVTWSLETNASWLSMNETNGLLNGTPLNQDVGTYRVNVTATSAIGGLASSLFNLTVQNVNDPPVLVSVPVLNATEDEPYLYDANATDVDPTGDNLTYDLSSYPSGMSINRTSGEINWTPHEGQIGTHDVMLIVQDDFGATDSQSFMITVHPVNDPPEITAPYTVVVTEDVPLWANITLRDVDDEVSELMVNISDPRVAYVRSNSTLRFLYPQNATSGKVNIRVTDGVNNVSHDINVSFVPVNDPPRLQAPISVTVTEDVVTCVNVTVSDPDNDADELEVSIDSPLVTFEATNSTLRFLYPDGAASGTVYINVSDGNITVQGSVIVQFVPVNDPPTLQCPAHLSLKENQTRWLEIVLQDVDNDMSELTVTTNSSRVEYQASNFTLKLFYPVNSSNETVLVTVSDGTDQVSTELVVTVIPIGIDDGDDNGDDGTAPAPETREWTMIATTIGGVAILMVILLLVLFMYLRRRPPKPSAGSRVISPKGGITGPEQGSYTWSETGPDHESEGTTGRIDEDGPAADLGQETHEQASRYMEGEQQVEGGVTEIGGT